MSKTKQLLEELSWEALDQEMENYFAEQEQKYYEQRIESINQLNKELNEN